MATIARHPNATEEGCGRTADAPTETLEQALSRVRFVDVQALRPVMDRILTDMGVDLSQPPLSVPELRRLIAEEGVKPEDNVFSRGIIEMREE